jgi:hypothetical protein
VEGRREYVETSSYFVYTKTIVIHAVCSPSLASIILRERITTEVRLVRPRPVE